MTTSTIAAAAPEYRGRGNVSDRMEYSGFKSREIAPGVHMLGGCFVGTLEGAHFHSHVSAYLIVGSTGSLLVDTGHPKDWVNIEPFVRAIIGDGLSYVFPTHEEYPHAGNLGAILEAFPGCTAVGDLRNYHLYYPEHEARFSTRGAHDSIDLGGRRFDFLPAVIHDLPTTLWGYDSGAGMLFVSDAFAYSHSEHAECTLFSTELPVAPTIAETGLVLDRALYWTRFTDCRDLIDQMHGLLERNRTHFIAPAHGNVVTNPVELTALMDEALLASRLRASGGG